MVVERYEGVNIELILAGDRIIVTTNLQAFRIVPREGSCKTYLRRMRDAARLGQVRSILDVFELCKHKEEDRMVLVLLPTRKEWYV